MDWIMPVNEMLENEITKITSTLVPPNFNGDVRTVRTLQESLSKLIDMLGEQSAAAQGLNKVITTAEKLRNSPAHILYLLKDHRAKEGKGEIIGMLKVGRKHLFLFDEHDQVREVEPLCVLDFYIVRDRQRMGYGRQLFDHMLHDLEIMPWEMAIDGPSPKMEKFLSRNYAIDRLMRQNNNFAVAPGFFERTDDDISNKSGRSTPAVAAAVGRFAAPKPASAIANVIHGPCYEEPSRRSPSPSVAGPSGRTPAAADEPAEWDDDWVEPSDEEEEQLLPDEQPTRSPPAPERPSTLGVQRGAGDSAALAAAVPAVAASAAEVPAAGMPSGVQSAAQSAAGTPSGGRRDSQLTDKGYFDVKYYHNRLW